MVQNAILYTFAITIVFLHICRCALNPNCPPPEDAYPCWCDLKNDESKLYCNHFDDSDDVHKGLHKLTNYKIGTVVLWKSFIDDLASNVFEGLNINRIIFERSTIQYQPPQFLGLENSLKYLEMYRAFREEYPMTKWSLGHLKSLKRFSITECQIPKLSNDWIQSSAPGLIALSLDDNKIEILGDKVFAKLDSVATLSFSDNKITELKRSMFPSPAHNLRSINANNNNIKSLPSDIFDEMNLSMLELEGNSFVTLDEMTWKNAIENFARLYLDDNPIHCDNKLLWLTKMRLPVRFQAACSSPVDLKHKSLRELTAKDLS